jgi:protease IV
MARRTVWIFGIILLALFILFGVTAISVYWLTRPRTVEVRQNSVLEVYLEGGLPELPPTSPVAQIFDSDKVSVIDLNRLLREAAKDKRIAALYLEIQPLMTSWAQLEEIRSFLQEFHKSKKKIYAKLAVDMAQEKELYLASAADEIYLNPDAGLLINGLEAEVSFYRRMMDKLKIEPQFLQFKEYKSPEVFTREKMTPEIRSMLESVLTDIQERFIQTVTADRKIDAERLRRLIQNGIFPAPLALKEHLVTALGYEDEIESKLMADKEGGGKEYRSISASDYLKAIRDRPPASSKNRVALVGGLGQIIAGSGDELWGDLIGGETLAKRLREVRQEKDIKGVLFRIDSPGGSAVGSDKIWREVQLLEKGGKPVVVSMAGVAGSGGYYIAMGARKIVAQPSTITGSIGVIIGKFNVRGLFEQWLGITVDKIKLAENADLLSPVTSLSEQQREQIRDWMEDVYNNFVRKASEGRGMKFEDLESKAHGRIYTGAQAKQLKLIDEVGGLNTALSVLKKELKIPEGEDVELVLYPKPKTLWQRITEGDFFKISNPTTTIDSYLKQTLQVPQTPAPWLLAPQVEIH